MNTRILLPFFALLAACGNSDGSPGNTNGSLGGANQATGGAGGRGEVSGAGTGGAGTGGTGTGGSAGGVSGAAGVSGGGSGGAAGQPEKGKATGAPRVDLNGDGFADLVVGANGKKQTFVYLGSPNGVAMTPTTVLQGPDGFGASVAGGDLNGDGIDDLLVAAPNVGQIHVYLGSAQGPSSLPSLILTQPGQDDYGGSVTNAGDLNGDGYADLVVGAASGIQAYVYLGSPQGPTNTPSATLQGTGGTFVGNVVASAGDVNGDGFSDLIIGEYVSTRAVVFLGSEQGVATTPTITLTGPKFESYGWSVTGAGDLNGDGFDDVAVGDPGSDTVAIYLGSAQGLVNQPSTTLTGAADSTFGGSLSSAGDVNHDGFADLLVGAGLGGMDGTEGLAGSVQLFLGSAAGLGSKPVLLMGGGEGFGQSLARAGDLNGDGFDDVVVGASGANKAYVYFGSAQGLSGQPSLTLTGVDFSVFGRGLASSGETQEAWEKLLPRPASRAPLFLAPRFSPAHRCVFCARG